MSDNRELFERFADGMTAGISPQRWMTFGAFCAALAERDRPKPTSALVLFAARVLNGPVPIARLICEILYEFAFGLSVVTSTKRRSARGNLMGGRWQ